MALLKDGTRIYGTLYANTEVVIGSLNVSSQIATAFDKANSAGIAANTPSSVANAAYNHANAAFIAANTGTGATGAYNAANAAFIVANSAAIAANTPSSVANAAFIRANNSINANTGGTITGNLVVVGNIVASIISTGGDSGDITGANNIYANTLYAKNIDVLTYINAAFNAANAGGGGSSTDQFARNTGNAAFIHANAAFNAANAGGGGSSTDQFARDTANSKSYIFYQNTAPVTSNSNDIWINTDNGAAYENFGTPASPIWAEMGPSNSIANTPPGTLALSTLNITSYISFTGNQRQTVPYQGYGVDNVARDTANSTAIRANNSLNANNGGTVTSNVVVVGNVHANLFITTGSGGDISNANTVYSNSVSTGNVTVSTLVTAANVVVNNNITVKANTTVLGNVNAAGIYQVNGKKAVNGPAFSAYADATLQTITSGSQQKVLFQTEEFDTDGCFASSRFTPTVPGYYQLNAQVRLDGASGTGEMMIVIYKNGAEYKRGTNQQGTQIAANFWAQQVSSLVYANGTTDYFEIYVQQGLGSSVTVTAVNNPAITWFNGCMLRGA
jgi:hypothetical protein